MTILECKNVKKVYTTKFSKNKVEALKDINFSVEDGEYIGVMGESGSGKTTLLNILASFDKPSGGQVLLENQDISLIKDNQLAAFRRENLGFVFQDFNLLNTFSIKDNILLPLVLSQEKISTMEEKVNPLLELLSIQKLKDKFPYEVSGGEQQRTAIARALITNPKLILADEPTGALDSKASQSLLEVFEKINQKGQTILMVTHSALAASHANRVLFIKDGSIYHQIYRGDKKREDFYEAIAYTLTTMATQATNSGKVFGGKDHE